MFIICYLSFLIWCYAFSFEDTNNVCEICIIKKMQCKKWYTSSVQFLFLKFNRNAKRIQIFMRSTWRMPLEKAGQGNGSVILKRAPYSGRLSGVDEDFLNPFIQVE
jgi:hypothetical protein